MLGSTIRLEVCDPAVADYLDRLYAAFPAAGAPGAVGADRGGELRVAIEPADDGRYRLTIDGQESSSADTPEALVGTVVNLLNRRVAEAAPQVLVHAGGVERDGAGVVLPAAMESGKTTLTTGLVRAGYRYLTDEAVAFDRASREIVPYPKPMSLDPGSWSLFPELEPDEPFATDGYKASQWQVPPAAIRADALGRPCRAGFVVFPVYEEGATTELVPLTRGEALVELTKNTFRFDQEGRPTLEVLAAIVADADVYRLPNGNLDEAIAAVDSLFP